MLQVFNRNRANQFSMWIWTKNALWYLKQTNKNFKGKYSKGLLGMNKVLLYQISFLPTFRGFRGKHDCHLGTSSSKSGTVTPLHVPTVPCTFYRMAISLSITSTRASALGGQALDLYNAQINWYMVLIYLQLYCSTTLLFPHMNIPWQVSKKVISNSRI